MRTKFYLCWLEFSEMKVNFSARRHKKRIKTNNEFTR